VLIIKNEHLRFTADSYQQRAGFLRVMLRHNQPNHPSRSGACLSWFSHRRISSIRVIVQVKPRTVFIQNDHQPPTRTHDQLHRGWSFKNVYCV